MIVVVVGANAQEPQDSLEAILAEELDSLMVNPGGNANISADKAREEIVALLEEPLAQYQAEAQECESPRIINNWIQFRGMCEVSLRSESTHDYLCASGSDAREVRATRSARVNLAEDIAQIDAIRQSASGWSSLVIELNNAHQVTNAGNFKTNRWQFTTSNDNLDALKRLAINLDVLRQNCEEAVLP